MAVSKQTSAIEALMSKLVKGEADEALRSLAYLHCAATNAVYDIDGASWDVKRDVLKRNAEFAQARYEQALGLVDAQPDPDEDLL